MSIELTVKSAPYQAKIFNKYVTFFRIYYHSINPLQGDILRPPPHFQKGKEKDHAETGFIWDFFCKLASNQRYTAFWMFYMDVVDQIFKNALTNTNSKHHFDVQWFIAVPFPLTFWNDAETADQHKEPMIGTNNKDHLEGQSTIKALGKCRRSLFLWS